MAPIFNSASTDNGLILQVDDPAITHDWEEAKRPPMSDAEYERFIMMRLGSVDTPLEGIPEDRCSASTSAGVLAGMHNTSSPSRQFAEMMLRVNAQAFSTRVGEVNAPQ